MLIIAGHLDLDPADRARYVAAFADLVRRARRAPGCLDLAIAADPLDEGRVNTYERWQSWDEVTAWRAVANAPEVDVEIRSVDVAMWDATGERDPFTQSA